MDAALSNDKVLHFLGSAALVLIVYVIQTHLCTCTKSLHEDSRLLYAALFTIIAGCTKQLGEWLLPLSRCPCRFDIWELMINLNGVAMALLGVMLWGQFYRKMTTSGTGNDDSTEASTACLEEGDNMSIVCSQFEKANERIPVHSLELDPSTSAESPAATVENV